MTRYSFTTDPRFRGPIPFVFQSPADLDFVYTPSLYPQTLPDGFDIRSDVADAITEKALRLVEDDPRIVLLDHPKWPYRKSVEAVNFMDATAWQPIRDRLGPDAKIWQYGIPRDISPPSLSPSRVMYDALAFLDPEVIADLVPGEAVWIPASGQWVPNHGGAHWTPRDFFNAIAALNGEVDDVLIWFDPDAYSLADHRATITTLCAAIGWPTTPVRPEEPEGAFGDLLRVLAAGKKFSMADLLDLLVTMKETP
jgi:LmbE family N-acetylglucosaminyl deacetylase